MENPIRSIVKFNQQAGLIAKGYSDFLESSFQIEEALEGFDVSLFEPLNLQPPGTYTSAKSLARDILSEGILLMADVPLSDVERLDKACDAVVFAVGSMAKLGLTAQQITQALNIVMHHNSAKLKCPKDEFGKLTKPADFVGPEPELQKLLDKRSVK